MSDVKPEARDVKTAQKETVAKKRMQGFGRYLSETRAELKKIVWPTPQAVAKNTGIVLLFMLVLGAFIWALDTITSLGFQGIVGLIK